MAWVKIDDQFHDHPKVLDVGPCAEALYFRGLTYATRFLTDGFIPVGHLRRMGDMDALAEAERLTTSGLWQSTEGGYLVHDYLDYQPSKEHILADRAKSAKRQAEWRDRNRNGVENGDTAGSMTGERGGGDTVTNAAVGSGGFGSNGASNDVTNGGVARAPSRPVPSRPDLEALPPSATELGGTEALGQPAEKPPKVRSAPKPKTTEVPERFEITAEMRGKAEGYGLPPASVDSETEKFLDHFRAKGERKSDWDAAWRNWMRRAVEYLPKPPSTGRTWGGSRSDQARQELEALQAIGRGEA